MLEQEDLESTALSNRVLGGLIGISETFGAPTVVSQRMRSNTRRKCRSDIVAELEWYDHHLRPIRLRPDSNNPLIQVLAYALDIIILA